SKLLLSASSTQLFKGPEIGEVFFGAGIDDTANPDIKAETGSNSEIALAYSNQLENRGQLNTGVTLFRTDINDYIYDYAAIPAGGGRWKDNVGDMMIDGYEAYLGYNIGKLKTLVTLSVAESELDAFADYTGLDGARLDRIQGDTLTLSADYDMPQNALVFHWDMMIVDDVDAGIDLDGASLDNSKDGFTVHNVSVRWTPTEVKGLSLTFGIDNLFDEFYASQSSRTGVSAHPLFGDLYLVDYEPGRNIKMTASYQF
ncbi:MAG: TonB-dependent receptor domain-containing protein, partial [Gammaproteobacteria bacterium]